jgi:hypothetical protein
VLNEQRAVTGYVSLTAGYCNGPAVGGKLLRPMNGREFLRKDPVLRGGYFFRGSFHDTSSVALNIKAAYYRLQEKRKKYYGVI